MNVNKKLFLGVLVFFVGVLLAACGGSEGAPSAAAVATDIPQTFESTAWLCTGDCTKTISGRFIVQDEDEYAETFPEGRITSTNAANSDYYNQTGNIWTDLFNYQTVNLVDGLAGTISCGINGAFGDDDCDPADNRLSDLDGNSDDDTLGTISAKVVVEVEDGEVVEIQLTVNAKLDGDSDSKTFLVTTDPDEFESVDGEAILINDRGLFRVYAASTTGSRGDRIGYFKD